jgi:hypothetical protein
LSDTTSRLLSSAISSAFYSFGVRFSLGSFFLSSALEFIQVFTIEMGTDFFTFFEAFPNFMFCAFFIIFIIIVIKLSNYGFGYIKEMHVAVSSGRLGIRDNSFNIFQDFGEVNGSGFDLGNKKLENASRNVKKSVPISIVNTWINSNAEDRKKEPRENLTPKE